MIRLNMLTGDLIFRKHKTGVHFMHENIMLKAIADDFFDLTVSFYRTKQDFLKKYDLIDGERVHCLFRSKIAKILVYFVPVSLLYGRQDVYFCDGIFPVVLGKGKRICLIHDLMVYRYPENYNILMKLYLKWYFYNVKRADRIIAVSKTTKKDIMGYLKIPSNKIDIAYPGVKRSIEPIISSGKIQEKYLFYIGDSRKNKNLIGAVNGFAQYIERTGDDMYFFIAGGGNKKDLIIEIKKLGIESRVRLLGYVSENQKNYLYKNAYAFLFVSFFEGFGVPVLEAMSKGVPVITSNLSSMKEIADGYAVLVDPKNFESISYGIQKLSDESVRKNYIKLGYECAKKYSWDRTYEMIKKSIINMVEDQ